MHLYKVNWEAAVGEEIHCRHERGNPVDLNAVSLLREEEIVAHLPRKISRVWTSMLQVPKISCSYYSL